MNITRGISAVSVVVIMKNVVGALRLKLGKWDVMKHCPNCGSELKAGAKFCSTCGQAVNTSEASVEKVIEKPVEESKTASTRPNSNEHTDTETSNSQVQLKQKTTTNQSMVIVVALVLLVVLGGFFFIKKRAVVSRDQLATNITKAVQNKDGKLFLKQFSKDDQALKFSDVGASSVVKDMHSHSRDSLSEVGRIIVDGQQVSGTEVKYHFNVESKQVLGLFTTYYLTTRRTPVRVLDYTGTGGPVSIKLKDADNQRVTKQMLNSGFFPGKYNFNVTSGDSQGDYWIWAAGDSETIDLTHTTSD